MFLRHDPRRVRQTVTDPREDQPVIPPEALTTPYWLQQKQRQQISLRQSPAPGAESHFTSAIMASIRRGKTRIGGKTHTLHLRIRNTKGEQIDLILHLQPHPEPPLNPPPYVGAGRSRKSLGTGCPTLCLRVFCEDRVGILTFFPPPAIGQPPKSSLKSSLKSSPCHIP